MATIAGIDIGVSGAIAFLDDVSGDIIQLYDMPLTAAMAGRRAPNAAIIADLLRRHQPVHAYVEKSWARPTDGAAASFTMGMSYGVVIGVLQALGIPYTEFSPPQWMRAAAVPMGMGAGNRGKAVSRARFTQLWPQHAADVARVKDHGRADAALIAHAGQLMHRSAEAVTGDAAGLLPRRGASGGARSQQQEGPGTVPGLPPGQTTSPHG